MNYGFAFLEVGGGFVFNMACNTFSNLAGASVSRSVLRGAIFFLVCLFARILFLPHRGKCSCFFVRGVSSTSRPRRVELFPLKAGVPATIVALNPGGPGCHEWGRSARPKRFPFVAMHPDINASRTPRDSLNTTRLRRSASFSRSKLSLFR